MVIDLAPSLIESGLYLSISVELFSETLIIMDILLWEYFYTIFSLACRYIGDFFAVDVIHILTCNVG